MRVYTIDELSTVLTESMVWRIRELSDVKRSFSLLPATFHQSLARAIVPILYAHWEGHVRLCASAYVHYVASKRLPYARLHRGYMLHVLRSELKQMQSRSSLSGQDQTRFLERLEQITLQKFKGSKGLVDTKSNLSFGTLCDIADVIGIDVSSFQDDASFIDKSLVARRNSIAHGESLAVTSADLDELLDRTIGLMRAFQNLVENAAVISAFDKGSL